MLGGKAGCCYLVGDVTQEHLVTLEDWAKGCYGERAPYIGTLRRWARDGKIFPLPQKHGRAYFVRPDAQYIEDYNQIGRHVAS